MMRFCSACTIGFALFFTLGFNACADKIIPSSQVKDLQTLPQDALFYLPTDFKI